MRAALVLTLVLAGCSSEGVDDCSNVSSDCPNEPSLAAECRVEAPTCPATTRALFLCLAAHQVCDGRGKLDRAASQASCPDLRAADERCRSGQTDAGVDASTGADSGASEAGDAEVSETTPDATPDATPG